MAGIVGGCWSPAPKGWLRWTPSFQGDSSIHDSHQMQAHNHVDSAAVLMATRAAGHSRCSVSEYLGLRSDFVIVREALSWCLFEFLFLFFWVRVACSLGWPRAKSTGEPGGERVSPASFIAGVQLYTIVCKSWGPVAWTQGVLQAREVFYQLHSSLQATP